MLGDKLRFRFAKTGTLRLLSHHDLMRCLERMLRRTGLPFKSTAGFHPSPRIVFALSLPLGVVGLDEVVEIEFTRPCDSDDVFTQLNAQAPTGLNFTHVSVVPMKATAIPRRVAYSLSLPADRAEETEERCRELMGQEKVWVARLKPGPKRLNVRPYLRQIALTPQPPLLFSRTQRDPSLLLASLRAGLGEGAKSCLPLSLGERGLGGEGNPGLGGEGNPGLGREGNPGLGGEGNPGLGGEGNPGLGGEGNPGLGADGQRSSLTLDLWVTQTGTARAEELLKLLGVADLLDVGAILERTTVELRDETTATDPTDQPPDGPADALPLDPATIAALTRQEEEQPATVVGGTLSEPVVE